MAPVRPVGLFLDPAQQPWVDVVHPARPLLPPEVTEDGGHGGEGVAGNHVEHPVDEIEGLEHTTHVVDVVRVTVVGGVDGGDRAELWRAETGDLERVEARP